MKKMILMILAGIMFVSCNNDQKKIGDVDPLKIEADSVTKKVMDGHDIGMSKMGKMMRAQKEVDRLLDSMGKASATDNQLKGQLESLKSDLDYADMAMNKWMKEFVYDTLSTDLKNKISYMENEHEKVLRVNEHVLKSLAKADTVLKRSL